MCEDGKLFSFIHGCPWILHLEHSDYNVLVHLVNLQLIVFAVGLKTTGTCSNSSGVQSQSACPNNKEITAWSGCPRLVRMSVACRTLWSHERKSVATAVRTPLDGWRCLALVPTGFRRNSRGSSHLPLHWAESEIAHWQTVWAICSVRKKEDWSDFEPLAWLLTPGVVVWTFHSRLIYCDFHTTSHVWSLQGRVTERENTLMPCRWQEPEQCWHQEKENSNLHLPDFLLSKFLVVTVTSNTSLKGCPLQKINWPK